MPVGIDEKPASVRIGFEGGRVQLVVDGLLDEAGGQIVFDAVNSAFGACGDHELEGIEIDLSAVTHCASAGSKWLAACVALGAEKACPVQFRFGVGGTT
jgi:hypothetical protein